MTSKHVLGVVSTSDCWVWRTYWGTPTLVRRWWRFRWYGLNDWTFGYRREGDRVAVDLGPISILVRGAA